jgi:transcriptional regulator
MPELSERDILIASRLAKGDNQKSIAKEFDLSQQHISYISQKDHIREIVERAHERLINSTLSKAVENLDYLVDGYKTTGDKQEKEHGYKATEKVLEAAGLLSSHAQSIVHQTYIAQQTNITNPLIDELINKHFGGKVLAKPVWEIEEGENATFEGEVKEGCVEEHLRAGSVGETTETGCVPQGGGNGKGGLKKQGEIKDKRKRTKT